ncbi:hypothetical protein EZ313_09490 [Ramlibacter henchirensis]|uniref:Uncharacterized protein n=1 Tax=Ramlibacter henchirensis TaxID=204072 RepID=A0A4Z0C9P3_9BURK|nr:hypothetical protein [Ramlibacter henchirensis]TFZ06835.1 hypothetical protein EZ313_09490 [Ramlibacter henchirensis]
MRFQPDTWLETWLRPVAMAAPDASVYVEIMAPDFRFLFALVLLVLLGGLAVLSRRRRSVPAGREETRLATRPVFVMLLALAAVFVPWLATTGNGRYFVVGLLMVGPVCIGLTRLLPVTRALRLTLGAGMVAWQAFAVLQSAPLQAWTFVRWEDAPYFHVEVPLESREHPATYVTMSAISYSLVTPLFHPQSRWLSLHNAPALDSGALDARRTEAFLSAAQPGRLMLLAPAVAGMLTDQRLPNVRISRVLDQQLAAYRLRMADPQACRFLPSRSLAEIGLGEKTPEERARSGFWLCHLSRVEAGGAPAKRQDRRYDAVFKLLEAQCPRFFPAGGDGASVMLANGEMRSYMQAEMKAYVFDSGEVHYKYYRALNPVLVGTVRELLDGKVKLDCSHIRGRSGLPWQREI